jgi:hypothetical protein
MVAHRVLAASGAACELVGFLLVMSGVSRALSEEYEEHGVFRRLWFGIKYLWQYVFEEPPKPIIHEGAASGSMHLSGSATGRKSPESDLERVERELRELRNDLDKHKEAVEQRFSTVEQRLQEATDSLAARATAIESRLDKIRRSSLHHEKNGARVFLFGAFLTLIAVFV